MSSSHPEAQQLRRSLKARHMYMIAIGGSIGTGLFVASGATVANAGPGGALLAYALIGFMVFLLMQSLGEMATYIPLAGSFGEYARRFVSPSFGFAIGWNYWYNWAITVAAELAAAALVMKYWAPNTPGWIWSAIFLAILFGLNALSARAYGEGEFALRAANLQYGVLGIRLAQQLGTGTRWKGFMRVFAPNREGQFDISNPASGFVVDSLLSPGVLFSVRQAKYDQRYILTSSSFARNLFGMQGMLTALELKLKPNASTDAVKKKIQNIVGNKYKVLDRYEQQEDTFRIMNVEKIIAYIFLTFILVVACFNIVGSLSMLIIDKKADVTTLRNLGATDKQIVRIFLFEGRMISALGALLGVGLGLLLCWLQQQYGLVSLGKSEGSFIVNAYPVSVHYIDVFWIFITVIAVGWLSVWYPVRYLSRKLLD